MDILEFLARSEWPVVVGGALWVTRGQLKAMVDRINPTKIDAWGIKAEFERKLDKVDALLPPDPASPSSSVAPTLEPKAKPIEASPTHQMKLEPGRFTLMVGSDVNSSLVPGVRIALAWNSLIGNMHEFYNELNANKPNAYKWNHSRPISELASEIWNDPNEVQAFKELETIRNRAVHTVNFSITDEDAKRFEDAVLRLRLKMVFG